MDLSSIDDFDFGLDCCWLVCGGSPYLNPSSCCFSAGLVIIYRASIYTTISMVILTSSNCSTIDLVIINYVWTDTNLDFWSYSTYWLSPFSC